MKRLTYLAGVTSAPRPKPTLSATLDSLAAAGWTEPAVFYDAQRRGPWWNFKQALTSLVMLGRCFMSEIGTPDCILIVEDDIEITPGLRWWIDRQANPHYPHRRIRNGGIYSLYCSAGVVYDVPSSEFQAADSTKSGALAYLMRFDTAMRLSSQVVIDPIGGNTETDTQIAAACSRDDGPVYFVHSPSFVRHTGTDRNSSLRAPCGNESTSQCREFVKRILHDGTFETVQCGVGSVQEPGDIVPCGN